MSLPRDAPMCTIAGTVMLCRSLEKLISRSNAVVTFNQVYLTKKWNSLSSIGSLQWCLLGLKSERYLHLASTCRNGKAAPSCLDQTSEALWPCSWRIRPGGIYPLLLPVCNLAGLSRWGTNPSSSSGESRQPGRELQLSQQRSMACRTPG